MTIVTKKDFRMYSILFFSIYRQILRPDISYQANAIVSERHGALIFFKFRKGSRRFSFRKIRKPIGVALQDLPQRGFKGDLSNVIFGGTNVVVEGSKLIIVKGSNQKEDWSPMEARIDANRQIEEARKFIDQ